MEVPRYLILVQVLSTIVHKYSAIAIYKAHSSRSSKGASGERVKKKVEDQKCSDIGILPFEALQTCGWV